MARFFDKHLLLIVGLAISMAFVFFYRSYGYNGYVLIIWLLSLASCIAYFYMQDGFLRQNVSRSDMLAFGTLLFIFTPLYFASLYDIPFQINTDEVTIMMFQQRTLESSNIFALSDYFGFPSLVFMATGFMQEMFGGISLMNARLVHAGMGVLIIAGSFLLFRQFWKTWSAFGAAVVLGASHTLFAISRMAMRDNSGLLVEVFSFALLAAGINRKNSWLSFIGGLGLGLSFYVYAPAKFLPFIWVAYLLALLLFRKEQLATLRQVSLAMAVGFFLVVAPLTLGNWGKAPEYATQFSRERFMFNEEGRKQQQEWVAAPTKKDGVIHNIRNGLSTFNSKVHDYGYIYPNYGHGFVDPMSGVLLWLGMAAVLFRVARHRQVDNLAIFLAVGFFSIYLAYAFIINKSPNYTRLLIILPFFAGFAWSGIFFLSAFAARLLRREWALPAVAAVLVAAVIGWNGQIFWQFAKLGLEKGNDVGSTARYIEAQAGTSRNYYLVADQVYRYYNWGQAWQWRDWGGFFADKNQTFTVLSPEQYPYSVDHNSKFTVFMSEFLWQQDQDRFKIYFPDYEITRISEMPPLMAIEVNPRTAQP